MTLSTSDTKRMILMRNALVYTAIAVFCAFAGAVYEHYGHGVYSYYMIYAFGFPLVGGTLPALVMLNMKEPKLPAVKARYFWHSAISVFTTGSIFKGVLIIYGTTNRLSVIYPAAGVLFLILSLIFCFIPEKSEPEEKIIIADES